MWNAQKPQWIRRPAHAPVRKTMAPRRRDDEPSGCSNDSPDSSAHCRTRCRECRPASDLEDSPGRPLEPPPCTHGAVRAAAGRRTVGEDLWQAAAARKGDRADLIQVQTARVRGSIMMRRAALNAQVSNGRMRTPRCRSDRRARVLRDVAELTPDDVAASGHKSETIRHIV